MKKNFNVFDAFTVLLVYLLFEKRIVWFKIFLPYLCEFIINSFLLLSTYYGWGKRLEFFFWKKMINAKVKQADKKAREQFGTNPGNFISKQDYPKQ